MPCGFCSVRFFYLLLGTPVGQGCFLAIFPATWDFFVSEILSFEQISLSFDEKLLSFEILLS